MEEDDFTPEEKREAEALARALERDHAEEALPEDALETAALLRYARDGGALADDKRDAILDEVFRSARPRRTARVGWLGPWRWPLLAAAAMTATVTVWIVVGQNESAQIAARTSAVPSPPTSLLRAQLSAASGGDFAQLENHMRPYRLAIVHAMEGRYER